MLGMMKFLAKDQIAVPLYSVPVSFPVHFDDHDHVHFWSRNRLLALIEKPPLDPIYIGLFGSTGAGKSSLLNAVIQQAMFLPVSGESTCTSCIVQVSSGHREQYEAKIHLLSDQVSVCSDLPPYLPPFSFLIPPFLIDKDKMNLKHG